MQTLELRVRGSKDFFTREAYKVLRSNIQFCGKDVKVVSLTSCHANEGKTITAIGLAKSFSDLGKKVLLIDADMRNSVMATRYTNAVNAKGLSEVLSGMEEVENCIYQTQYEGLQILFAGKFPPNPVELLESVYFSDLIKRARESYDYVIIDNAPVGLVIDAAVVGPLCDGTALVFKSDVRYREAEAVIDQLQKSNSKILGVIRNRMSLKKKKRKKKPVVTEQAKKAE